MYLNNLDLNLLVSLDALLQEKNVTQAAKRVHVTQPAMSGALQRLRQYFNDEILVRAGRNLELTPRAQSLVVPIREILLQIQDTVEKAPEFNAATTHRRFSVVMSDYSTAVLMPHVLHALNENAPGIEIDVAPLGANLNRQIESGRTELAVVPADFNLMVSEGPMPEDVQSSMLFTDSWVCAVSEDHPHIRKELTLEDYLEYPHVVPNFGDGVITFEEVAIRQASLHIKTRAAIPSFTTLLSLIPGSTLIATVQKRLAMRHVDQYPIRLFEPPLKISELKEVLVWHKRNDYDPGLIWFRDLITRTANELPEYPDRP